MNGNALEIRPDPKMQLAHLAEESHRSKSDLANGAVTLYIGQLSRIAARIHEGLAQALRGEFVSDDDVEAFFYAILKQL